MRLKRYFFQSLWDGEMPWNKKKIYPHGTLLCYPGSCGIHVKSSAVKKTARVINWYRMESFAQDARPVLCYAFIYTQRIAYLIIHL